MNTISTYQEVNDKCHTCCQFFLTFNQMHLTKQNTNKVTCAMLCYIVLYKLKHVKMYFMCLNLAFYAIMAKQEYYLASNHIS